MPPPFSFDDAQRAAIGHPARRLAVVAGPGAGKTAVLAARSARLIREHAPPGTSVLALSFTNKAADELRTRIAALLSPDDAQPRCATFHAIAYELVNAERAERGVPWTLAGVEQQSAFARAAARAYRGARRFSARAAATAVSRRKLSGNPDAPNAAFCPDALFAAYERAREDAGALDFDDLLREAARILNRREAAGARRGAEFRHILVDEYQDTSPLEAAILTRLARRAETLWVIGDPAQAIYGFRGASRAHFLDFSARYPGAARVALARNYRASGSIVALGRALMRHSGDRESARIAGKAVRPAGQPVRIVDAPDAREEARHVLRSVEELIGGSDYRSLEITAEPNGDAFRLSDIAVLARTRNLLSETADALRRAGLPARLAGADGASRLLDGRNARTLLDELRARPAAERDATTVADTLRALARARGAERDESALALIALAHAYDGLPFRESRAALLARAATEGRDALRGGAGRTAGDTITLATAHAAKGLEFRAVFVVGVEEGAFPHRAPHEGESQERTEEECRLLYVAATRARDFLALSFARTRVIYGIVRERAPSRFL